MTAHVGDSLSGDDVTDLVIGVAVERRFARLDDSHELRHVEAPGVLVHEISKAPLDRGFELGLVVEADRDLTGTRRGDLVFRCENGQHVQVRVTGVLHGIGLAWREVDAHVGLELMDASVDVQLSPSVDDEEHLLLSVQRPLG